MSISSASMTSAQPARGEPGDRLVLGLEAIIDATAGILAAQSLQETLQAMADALYGIVSYTSLAVYEVDWAERVGIPLLATGHYVAETLASRPSLESSITGSAILGDRLVCRDSGDPVLMDCIMPGTQPSDVESIVVAPLRIGGNVQGTLNVWREDDLGRHDLVRFSEEELTLLERFASLAAIAYANSTQREALRTQALTDALTGLYNRRHCETSLASALQDGRRHDEPTSVAYFDIDAFKAINDEFGHGSGDDALRSFAQVLRGETRAGDVVCRTGGEEFTVVLPRTDAAAAQRLAERIAHAVRAAGLGPFGGMTVSGGVATSRRSAEDAEWLIRRADAALMDAKRDGRDRVVLAINHLK